MSDVTCLSFYGREYFVVNGRYISSDCVCAACSGCGSFASCIKGDINSVLCETGCVALVYHVGCAGNCKCCFYPASEEPECFDY